MTDPQQFDLRIEKAVYGGSGLARHQGQAIFTPFTLPGEVVTAHVTKAKGGFAEAALDAVLEPSAARISPPCPYFGRCGGCHYQHASYPEQLAMKAAILEETLTRAGLSGLPAVAKHAGEPFGYRNRIRLHIDPGTSALGYRERASHRLLAVEVCPIAAPELEQALGTLAGLLVEQRGGSLFSQAELSVNHDGSELLLAFWLRSAGLSGDVRTRLGQLCERLAQRVPALRGAGVHAAVEARDRAGRRGGRERDPQHDAPQQEEAPGALIATWGTPRMSYRVAGHVYGVSLGAFFQVNRTLVDALVGLATDGRGGALAWDLYAGVGLFSRMLARSFEQVVAVEGAPISAGDLRLNLSETQQVGAHQAVCASTLAFLQRETARGRTQRGRRPDFVLVDPPRAGLGAEVTELLCQIRPAEVTYVSCDPATLARDLRALVDSGYKLQQLDLIDLFPQTFHLESVVRLSLP